METFKCTFSHHIIDELKHKDLLQEALIFLKINF